MSKIYNLTNNDKEITLIVGEDSATLKIETIGEVTINNLSFVGDFPEINSMAQCEMYKFIETKDGAILAPKNNL